MSIPGHYAVMATREVVVALAALHTRAGISDGKGAAGDLLRAGDHAGWAIPFADVQLATAGAWVPVEKARVLNSKCALARGAGGDDRTRHCIPSGHVVLAVSNAWVSRIGHAESTL